MLRDLRSQLHQHLTSPASGRLLTLPPFRPDVLADLEAGAPEHRWLLDASEWRRQRDGLPSVLVLRSEGPVFSSGHDLNELAALATAEVRETFALCAEVMSLIRQSPAIVVCPVQGLATAAGCQLALTADVTIARESTRFCLPGMTIGLPCTSPVTAVSRRLSAGLAYRMFATGEAVAASQMEGAVDVVPEPQGPPTAGEPAAAAASAAAFEARVAVLVRRLAEETPGQPQALGKWAFWSQLGLDAAPISGDGFQDAAAWAAGAMALHAAGGDARAGFQAFLEKRSPEWLT